MMPRDHSLVYRPIVLGTAQVDRVPVSTSLSRQDGTKVYSMQKIGNWGTKSVVHLPTLSREVVAEPGIEPTSLKSQSSVITTTPTFFIDLFLLSVHSFINFEPEFVVEEQWYSLGGEKKAALLITFCSCITFVPLGHYIMVTLWHENKLHCVHLTHSESRIKNACSGLITWEDTRLPVQKQLKANSQCKLLLYQLFEKRPMWNITLSRHLYLIYHHSDYLSAKGLILELQGFLLGVQFSNSCSLIWLTLMWVSLGSVALLPGEKIIT